MCIFTLPPPFLNCAGLSTSTLTPSKHLICWKSLYMVDGIFLRKESSKWRYLKLSKIPLIPDTLANSVKRTPKESERLLECFHISYVVTSFSVQLALHSSLGSAFRVASFITPRKRLNDAIGMAQGTLSWALSPLCPSVLELCTHTRSCSFL